MAGKLRELERWYVEDRNDLHTYNPAYVAAHGWKKGRTGIYLTAKKTGERVRIAPGLKTKRITGISQAETYRKDGYDGVTFKLSDGNERMLIFDVRNVTKPVGPLKTR